jgi:hypothetical protein
LPTYSFRAGDKHPTTNTYARPYAVEEAFEAENDAAAVAEGQRRAQALGAASDLAWVSTERPTVRVLLWASKPDIELGVMTDG